MRTPKKYALDSRKSCKSIRKRFSDIEVRKILRAKGSLRSGILASSYETNGNLSFDNVEADLSPSGRQLDLNLGYQASLNNLFNVGIQMAFSQDYGHIKSDEIIHSAAAFLKFDF